MKKEMVIMILEHQISICTSEKKKNYLYELALALAVSPELNDIVSLQDCESVAETVRAQTWLRQIFNFKLI